MIARGNLFQDQNGNLHAVETIMKEDVVYRMVEPEKVYAAGALGEIKPIPMAAEWWERWGLHPECNYIKGMTCIFENGTLRAYFEDNEFDPLPENIIELKYVHDFQNLYEAMEGKQLPILDYQKMDLLEIAAIKLKQIEAEKQPTNSTRR